MDLITIIPFHTVGDTNMEARKSTVTIVHASSLGTKYTVFKCSQIFTKVLPKCEYFPKYNQKSKLSMEQFELRFALTSP